MFSLKAAKDFGTCIKSISTGNCCHAHREQSCGAGKKPNVFPLTTEVKHFLYNLTNTESSGECNNFN